jgi:hypothetical protein
VTRLSRSALAIGAVGLLALAIRVLYARSMQGFPVGGDALTFHLVGQGLADGHGFREAFPPFGPTAEHPPAFEVLLAALDKLGANGYGSHRLALAFLGSVNVVLVGLLGRALAGPLPGVLAALLAAVHPLLFTADGALMSETLYGTLLLGALLAAWWARARPTPARFAVVGALIALAALARGEALALLVLLVAPLAWSAAPAWRPRLVLLGAAVAAFALVLAPWTIRNAVRFDTPVLISTNSNGVFVGANCPDTYRGPLIGAWRFQCYTPRRPGEDEAAYFLRQRGLGLDYARDHAGRLPAVLVARVRRQLDLYDRGQSIFLNAAEGRRGDWVSRGIRFEWGLYLLALAGGVVLVRRRAGGPLLILLAPVGMVLAVALVTYGTTRFRYAAEPSLCVLAAVALSAAASRPARARARPA